MESLWCCVALIVGFLTFFQKEPLYASVFVAIVICVYLLSKFKKYWKRAQKETTIVPVPIANTQSTSDQPIVYDIMVQKNPSKIDTLLKNASELIISVFKHAVKFFQSSLKTLRINTITIFKLKKERFLINRSKKKAKIRSLISFLIQISGGTIVFVVLEVAFVRLLNAFGNNFSEVWILEMSVILQYVIFLYTTYRAGKSKVLKFFKIVMAIFVLVLLSGLDLIVVSFFKSLVTLQIILNMFILYYNVKIVLFVKSRPRIKSTTKIKSLLLICSIVSSNIGSTLSLYFLPNTIEIQPKSKPEIVFLCGSSELPTDPTILDTCKEYNIGFMPTIRDYMVGNDLYMQTYKKVVAHGLNLYFLLGGNSNFYAYIDNAEEFPAIYKNISRWFVEEGIMDNPHMRSFSVDAEAPVELLEKIYGDNISDSVQFGYNNYPTLEEIENATKAYVKFTDLVRRDGKECGMVHAAKYSDPADKDGDLSLFTRNIYSLDIAWNFTIPMIYRTNYFWESDKTHDPPIYLETSVKLFYGANIEGTRFTISSLSFYQLVSLEQNSGHSINNNQYIFIGNFGKDFKDTKYIGKKEYLIDFDICRHFGKEKIFLYDLQGFLYHYGWEGVKELGRHNQQKNKIYLNYDNYQSFAFLMLYFCLIFVDIFAFFERDLIDSS